MVWNENGWMLFYLRVVVPEDVHFVYGYAYNQNHGVSQIIQTFVARWNTHQLKIMASAFVSVTIIKHEGQARSLYKKSI